MDTQIHTCWGWDMGTHTHTHMRSRAHTRCSSLVSPHPFPYLCQHLRQQGRALQPEGCYDPSPTVRPCLPRTESAWGCLHSSLLLWGGKGCWTGLSVLPRLSSHTSTAPDPLRRGFGYHREDGGSISGIASQEGRVSLQGEGGGRG